MKFHLIASGSKGNCFILQEGNRTIVIDCGGTKKHLNSSFERLGISYKDVDLLLISHSHTDHIGQISLFKDNLIYSPVPLNINADVKVLKPSSYFYVDKMKVTTIPLSHDADRTIGFIFETKLEKLVYITDTGYINTSYLGLLYNADYIILESNHDIEMLMKCSRPQFIKSRICSDYGHLSNEDCAATLEAIVTPRTKEIFLAHISQQANTYEKALEVNVNYLIENKKDELNKSLRIVAAKQFEMVSGGINYEKNDDSTSLFVTNLEWVYNL